MTSEPEDDVLPLRLRVMGVTVEVAVSDKESRTRLARQWSRAMLADGEDPGQVVRGPEAGPGPPETEAARDYMLTTRVTLAGLEATKGERLNLHAGGLADDAGRVLAIIGASGTGKTTATRALASRLHYLSDETVSIRPDRRVLPHPKPLSVIVDPERPHHKEQLSPDELGLLSTPESGVLSRLVLLHRGGASRRGLVPIDTASAMLQIIEQSSSTSLVPEPLLVLVGLIRSCGGALALEYDEIGDHLDDLVGLLGRDPEPAAGPEAVHHAPPLEPTEPLATSDAGGDGEGDPRIRRRPWVDAVELDGEVVILLTDRAVRLADLTATVWLHLGQPRTLEELVDRAQRVHGTHPEAATLVEAAVAALVEGSLAARGSLA